MAYKIGVCKICQNSQLTFNIYIHIAKAFLSKVYQRTIFTEHLRVIAYKSLIVSLGLNWNTQRKTLLWNMLRCQQNENRMRKVNIKETRLSIKSLVRLLYHWLWTILVLCFTDAFDFKNCTLIMFYQILLFSFTHLEC